MSELYLNNQKNTTKGKLLEQLKNINCGGEAINVETNAFEEILA